VRLVVDGAKCDGHGICALILPERISLDAWGYASIENDPIEGHQTLARAQRAVNACPVQALSLVGPVDITKPLRRGVGRRQSDRLR
jgi:ferredoxin